MLCDVIVIGEALSAPPLCKASSSSTNASAASSTMQSTLGCLSRLVSRSLVTGVVQTKEPPPSCCASSSSAASAKEDKDQPRMVTAVSGFPKQKSGYNIDNILKGQIGDDAYFVARHIDDWSSDEQPSRLLNPAAKSAAGATTVPACSTTRSDAAGRRPGGNSADVLGVADGVGGWRQYGVDPGQFSSQLMRNCERLVRAGYLASNAPDLLLAQGFRELQDCKQQVVGSSTACVVMLSHQDRKLYTANLGDSGFLVVRDGEVVHRSIEQQHSFNTPFQLSLPPSEMASDVLVDSPDRAQRENFSVEDGDVILLATDGLFDNVPDTLLCSEIRQSNTTSAASADDLALRLQKCANSIALIARTLSQDPDFLSPFAQNARSNGFPMSGGKEDDITVLLAAVKLGRNV